MFSMSGLCRAKLNAAIATSAARPATSAGQRWASSDRSATAMMPASCANVTTLARYAPPTRPRRPPDVTIRQQRQDDKGHDEKLDRVVALGVSDHFAGVGEEGASGTNLYPVRMP